MAARMALVLVVQAKVISVVATLPWAHFYEWLVISDVGGETTEFLIRQFPHDVHEFVDIVGPAKPSTVGSIKSGETSVRWLQRPRN